MNRSKARRVVGALTAFLAAGTLLAGHGGKIDWGNDFEKGKAQAKKENRLMMVYFTADG